ncbi:MAG: Rne/Rng family ribonuclease [Gammaproteobacteria bacterium]|nr:Rne/Rng family ribonuclease [Gammaproteobacteria bacterium]
MSVEIFINIAPRESRAALLEDGVLQEVHIERASRRGIVGNLYKGRVTRVLPGMQAAFVDIGLARTAFLHAHDIAVDEAGIDAQRVANEGGSGGPAGAPASPDAAAPEVAAVPDIRRLLRPGDDLLVQVLKDPMGSKGARLSSFVSLPSRYLVFMPRGSGIGVSARIADEAERQRLREAMQALVAAGHPGGYIVRTAAEGVDAARLAADLDYLERLWAQVRERSLRAAPGGLVHEDLPLARRILRDELARGVARVLVDDAAELAQLEAFVRDFLPREAPQLELHAAPRPIFDLHGIEAEIDRALEREVPLRSGGHLVIDQTESMTTIDVNTGGFVGHRDLEDTILRTNLEAAAAIARQLRLRNLGGIIIIDFIDMQDAANRERVLAALRQALAADHAQTGIAPMSPFGLVEMTRKRTRESLERQMCEPCSACEGRGRQRSVETVCQDILRALLRQSRQQAAGEALLVLAHRDVVERLLGEEAAALAALEAAAGRPVRLQAETLYAVDRYDVVVA